MDTHISKNPCPASEHSPDHFSYTVMLQCMSPLMMLWTAPSPGT
jgi:hypothetical protein